MTQKLTACKRKFIKFLKILSHSLFYLMALQWIQRAISTVIAALITQKLPKFIKNLNNFFQKENF